MFGTLAGNFPSGIGGGASLFEYHYLSVLARAGLQQRCTHFSQPCEQMPPFGCQPLCLRLKLGRVRFGEPLDYRFD